MTTHHKFLFLGNGSYNNHGCEAIVQGTMAILRQSFGGLVTAANGVGERPPVVDYQEKTIPISNVASFSIFETPSFISRCHNKLTKFGSGEVITARQTISPHARDSIAMLALGGDNFSLEYGTPYNFLGWNALARNAGLPTFIWGASIGPFSKEPIFEAQFVKHAQTLTRIFVRETETLAYLTRLGLGEKLHLAADPAFAMSPVKPARETNVLSESIGINLSPLMAEFVTAGNIPAWREMAVAMLVAVAKKTERPIALVPHVNATDATRSCDPGWYYKDDHGFLADIADDPRLKGIPLTLLGNDLGAQELKHEISRLWAFAGARTHATIAAFSTGVPCISLAYSVKALGLNKDIFDTTEFCISPTGISPKRLVDAFGELERSRASVIDRYRVVIPKMAQSAYAAGDVLHSDIAKYHEVK